VSPLRGEKPQNRPLIKLNNLRFALHAMLPVNDVQKRDGQKSVTDRQKNVIRRPGGG